MKYEMPVIVSLGRAYGYVLFSASTASILPVFHEWRLSILRKNAGVPSPLDCPEPSLSDPKAQEKYKLSLALREHSNYQQNMAAFLGSLLIGGLKYPHGCAIMGMVWIIVRILSLLGYTTPFGEDTRVIPWLPINTSSMTFALYFMSFRVAWEMLNGDGVMYFIGDVNVVN